MCLAGRLVDVVRRPVLARHPGRPRQLPEILLWSGLFGAAEAIAAVMGSAWGNDPFLVVAGFATQLFATSSTVYIQRHAADEQRAHSLAAYNSGFLGFVPAGAFVVAAIAASAGVRWSLIGPGLVLVAFTIVAAVRLSLAPSVSGYKEVSE
jgi:hypothetical protein